MFTKAFAAAAAAGFMFALAGTALGQDAMATDNMMSDGMAMDAMAPMMSDDELAQCI